jgi:hypothetical protein
MLRTMTGFRIISLAATLGLLSMTVEGCATSPLRKCLKSALSQVESSALDSAEARSQTDSYFQAASCDDGSQVQFQTLELADRRISLQVQAQNASNAEQLQTIFAPDEKLLKQQAEAARQRAEQLAHQAQQQRQHQCCPCKDDATGPNCASCVNLAQLQCPGEQQGTRDQEGVQR